MPGPARSAQAVLDSHEDEIIEAIRCDRSYRALAAEYGVSLGTFGMWVNANPERSDACARAREDSADQCDAEAELSIREAKNSFQLAKAKELGYHLRWRAKSRNPKRYGDKQQIGISGSLSLEQLVSSSMKPPDEPGGG